MAKRHYVIIGISILLLILMFVILFLGKKPADQNEIKKDKKYKFVKVQKVETDSIQLVVNGFGRVASSRNVILSSEAQGMLLSSGFNFKAGESFKKGELLFKVDDTQAQLLIKARKSSFLNLVATVLPDIKIDFPDNSASWNAFISDIDLNSPLPKLPSFKTNKEKTFLAAKNILSEYYSIKAEEERIRKYNVYAPFNGSIVETTAEIGAIVNPGTPIATIIKTVELEVAIPIDPSYITLINIGNNVELKSSNNNLQWKGKVARIAKNINPNTQSVDVYIKIINNGSDLYNGMYLEANINANTVVESVEIPRRALLDGNKIYTVQDSLLISKKIAVVKRNKNTIITNSLLNDELVVVEPVPGAIDSLKVAPIIQTIDK